MIHVIAIMTVITITVMIAVVMTTGGAKSYLMRGGVYLCKTNM